MKSNLTKFTNCTILRNHKIIKDDIWVRNGTIVDPEKVFFDERSLPDAVINCNGNIVCPGFIEIQINGGFGHDFSYDEDTEKAVNVVAKNLLQHGVTSFCPTVVTSPSDTYKLVLPKLARRTGGKNGATVLGAHVEGPFINVEKKGAHPPDCIKTYSEDGLKYVEDVYGSLDNIKIITMAPEFENSVDVIKALTKKNIVVSVGHSAANLAQAEDAVKNGASLITHLFNAMLPFHHRDPGLVGLLASNNIPNTRQVYFGIISDGIHTHPAALRIAYRVHPDGLILVTDAISALGLQDGKHHIGQLEIEVRQSRAFVAGTNTLCGSIANMIECIRIFIQSTQCSLEYALEAASLHPARALGIENKKGTLDFGADADFVMLNDKLELLSTWIAGELVYSRV